MGVHDWERSHKLGRGVERRLDQALGKHYIVREVPQPLQEYGIDRIITSKKTRVSYSVEYKADFLMWVTGNVFIETLSRSDTGRVGWVKSMMAQVLAYADIGTGVCYFVKSVDIKALDLAAYPKAQAQNPRYYSEGHTVPMKKLTELAFGRVKFDNQGIETEGDQPPEDEGMWDE